jgi:uncharacterized membrane protein
LDNLQNIKSFKNPKLINRIINSILKMLENFTYYPIYDIPLIVYIGIFTLIIFFITALIAYLKRKGKIKISIKWHYYLAYISILLGLFHGIIALLAYV